MRRIDGYLSNKIQALYPKSKVLVSDNGDFILQRENEPDLEIGKSFKEARASIFALLRADTPLLHQNQSEAFNILAELVMFLKFHPDPASKIEPLLEKATKIITAEVERTKKKWQDKKD